MSFKMIANRSVYRIDEGKEYKKGESFTVETEREKNRLLRYKRASLDESNAAPVKEVKPVEAPRAPVVQKVLVPEAPAAPAPVVAEPDPKSETVSVEGTAAPARPGRYRRSDMRAED